MEDDDSEIVIDDVKLEEGTKKGEFSIEGKLHA